MSIRVSPDSPALEPAPKNPIVVEALLAALGSGIWLWLFWRAFVGDDYRIRRRIRVASIPPSGCFA